MNKLHFAITINAPREHVWKTMLEQDSYRQWTAPFAEGSSYEGGWNKGDRIVFLSSLSSTGEGMVAEIAESRHPEFLSIRHRGTIKDGVEDTESEAVRAWAPAYENYTFSSRNGGTEVAVDMDTMPEYEAYMNEAWPKALAKLKEISEKR